MAKLVVTGKTETGKKGRMLVINVLAYFKAYLF